jgi:uncharacterized protein (DUF1501 family)
MSKHHISRRKFIGQAACGALGSTTLFSTLLNLKSINAASIFNSSVASGSQGYKALVCLMLSGGNDGFNMLIPRNQDEYNQYATTRSNMAIPLQNVRPLTVQNTPGRLFGLHPSLENCQQLFNSGKMAFVTNVGSLIEHVNRQQVWNGSGRIPLGLFSHSDQIMHWQTAIPQDRVAAGWVGKMADMLKDSNGNQNISMNLSLSGTNLLQTGNESVEYTLDRQHGSVGIRSYDQWPDFFDRHMGAVNNMIDATYLDPFEQSYKEVIRISREGHEQIQDALSGLQVFNTQFSDNWVSESFEMIAKMIAVRSQLDMTRQVFFIDFSGWDHHDELLQNHEDMLGILDNALFEFNSALEELDVDDQVTTFGLSEFARTLTSNGNGTDHGWGSNVFVMGGAVNGGNIYGEYPDLRLGQINPLELGGGVLIPTTSADEYFAEIAMWFGVPDSELEFLFPNIDNFYNIGSGNPLGFLNI